MKARYLLMVALVLLLAAPVATAQDGWPTVCGQESRGHAPECFDKSAGDAAAPKPAGLAQPAPAGNPGQGGWPTLCGYESRGHVPECFDMPAVNTTSAKPAGLAQPDPVAPQKLLPCCGPCVDPSAVPRACLH
jgi:hypothetical protein